VCYDGFDVEMDYTQQDEELYDIMELAGNQIFTRGMVSIIGRILIQDWR
jgi:hypothetical protein